MSALNTVPESSGWIPSPLNYTGGKYRLLSQILPRFPRRIDTFVDLFCGGGNVGINAPCRQAILNDQDARLIGMFRFFQQEGATSLLARVEGVIRTYGLSRSDQNGYAYYGCDSGRGLADYNRGPFLRLREDFNRLRPDDPESALKLYVLIVYAFNNQMRFNDSGSFNLPVGKRDFNLPMQDKLRRFSARLQTGHFLLECQDFRRFDLSRLGPNDFLYLDPPYLITCATYNEKNGWNAEKERDLLAFLDEADARGIRFALSNVLHSGGQTNRILLEWTEQRQTTVRVRHLSYSYANASYHKKNRSHSSDEVLITNYRLPTGRPSIRQLAAEEENP